MTKLLLATAWLGGLIVATLLEQGQGPQRADPGAAARPAGQAMKTTLYPSCTMHIEPSRRSWPDPDRLIAFFRRATAAGKEGRTQGMRWSIGADIGWLEGEPRAGEVVRALETLGVEWDVHAHQLADR